MRVKKVRGHKRIWKDIDKWVENNKRLDIAELNRRQRDYLKVWIHPWSGFSVLNSEFIEPFGKTRAKILAGLIDIYKGWKKDLDNLGEPYYLKMWLHEPCLTRSQVVCAVGDFLNFYETTFHKPLETKLFKPQSYGNFEQTLAEFTWEYAIDEYHTDKADVGDLEMYDSIEAHEQAKRAFEKMLLKPHRTTQYSKPIGDVTEGYSFKVGTVWIGGKE